MSSNKTLITPLVDQYGAYGLAKAHVPIPVDRLLAKKLVERGRFVEGKSDEAKAREKRDAAARKAVQEQKDAAGLTVERKERLRELLSDVPDDALTTGGEPDVAKLNARLEEGEEPFTAEDRSFHWAAIQAEKDGA